ncbi:Mannose-1-phosphate guanylyltransferase (GDP) [Lunatimonas lonarensis]|uniref:Mannose-1-phosphate guanylyltransferase (GDP) n=1 Tax=Lunatimonas lonarensis TaxID=1232681 RepID=R7ZTY4_9BACT|nr:sugar phosphate nucleotidyltransferase [Lunatimonas lonarensis]EON77508.1 Mannose-1-phosphate guanylyltransferase (GDP) [Lunatimonas lonarensis]
MRVINVVLSGGVGSRLWPLSRKSKPKQYLPIFDGHSLFELTVKRNLSFCENVIVVGGKDNYELSRESLERLGVTGYLEIIEAMPRNTAAAIAFAAFASQADDILLVTPSDHLIQDESAYAEAIREAIALAGEENLVTFGLVPTKPETGFGYIEHKGNEVISFREKPNKVQAEEFISQGNFLWNSGMFCFSSGVFLAELQKHEPEVYRLSKLAYECADEGFLPAEESLQIPSISVDYAVMERSKRIKVVPSHFKWSDMGSFEALYEHTPVDDPNRKGTNLAIGSKKRVEFLGVEDVILVETEDAILVLNRTHAQDVKKIYERLEKENPELLA